MVEEREMREPRARRQRRQIILAIGLECRRQLVCVVIWGSSLVLMELFGRVGRAGENSVVANIKLSLKYVEGKYKRRLALAFIDDKTMCAGFVIE